MDLSQKPSENSQYVPLAPKIDEIAFTIHQKDIKQALFTETWLKDLIADDFLKIKQKQESPKNQG